MQALKTKQDIGVFKDDPSMFHITFFDPRAPVEDRVRCGGGVGLLASGCTTAAPRDLGKYIQMLNFHNLCDFLDAKLVLKHKRCRFS